MQASPSAPVGARSSVASCGGERPSSPSEGALQRRCLAAFRDVDTSRDGYLGLSELHGAIERFGLQLSAREFRALVADIDKNGDRRIDFEEFQELVKQAQAKSFARPKARIPRMYLTPEAYKCYSQTFKERAGEDGFLSQAELEAFFRERKMNVSKEKMNAIMQEVDADGSGFVDESEFLSLMAKAAGAKKRKVGPGACSLASLVDEGWSLQDLKRIGYEVRDFVEESSCSTSDLMDMFTIADLRRAGKSFGELLAAGWDAMDARAAGFSLTELLQAGCSMHKLRSAGWDDALSAVQLRKLGADVGKMRLGGWKLSELRAAGYGTGALRAAGFAPSAIQALQRIAARQDAAKCEEDDPPLERRTTLRLIREADERWAAAPAGSDAPQAEEDRSAASSY